MDDHRDYLVRDSTNLEQALKSLELNTDRYNRNL